jgi:DNA-binding LacI/PurR family transcriptional regulator
MRQPFADMTRALADLLQRRIAGDAGAGESVILAATLVRRASA